MCYIHLILLDILYIFDFIGFFALDIVYPLLGPLYRHPAQAQMISFCALSLSSLMLAWEWNLADFLIEVQQP